MPFKRLRSWFRKDETPPPDDKKTPKHFGELWDVLQQIAREEDPERFESRSVAQHAAESLEGKKDVDRWLEIYLRRTKSDHHYRFPSHHLRHRGFCLIARHWPDGTVWEAFDDDTLLRASLETARSRDELIAHIDKWLDEQARPG